MNCTAQNNARTFKTSKSSFKGNGTSVSICLICGQKGYHSIIITSCHSYVTASGTPLTKFLNKVIGEEPCYSISTLICQNCYILLDRLDTYQARAAEINHHISTRYKDTKFGFIGNRQQRISELIVSSLSDIKSFKNGTTLNVNDELSVTVFHEALARKGIRNNSHLDRENLMIFGSNSSHRPMPNNLNSDYLNLKRKRVRPLSRYPKKNCKTQESPLLSLIKRIDANDSKDLSMTAELFNNKVNDNLSISKDVSISVEKCNEEKNAKVNLMKCNGTLPVSVHGKLKVKSKTGESSSGAESDEGSDCSSGSDSSGESKKKKRSSSASSSSIGSSNKSSSDSSSDASSSDESSNDDEKIDNPEADLKSGKKEDVNDNFDKTDKMLNENEEVVDDKLKLKNVESLSHVAVNLEKENPPESKSVQQNFQIQEIGAMDSHLAEAVLMQNSLATNLLQSFMSTSLWMNSSESSSMNLNNNLSEHNLNHVESLQQNDDVEDITVDSLGNAVGSVNEKKRRLELKNTGRSYINTKGKLVDAKRVWPQDCSRCPLKCNGRMSDEERLLVFADYWNLGDYDRQREYLAKHMEREERVGPSGHTRTVILYFLTHLQNRIQVCRQFFLKTLDVSEKASRIVLVKKVKAALGTEQSAVTVEEQAYKT